MARRLFATGRFPAHWRRARLKVESPVQTTQHAWVRDGGAAAFETQAPGTEPGPQLSLGLDRPPSTSESTPAVRTKAVRAPSAPSTREPGGRTRRRTVAVGRRGGRSRAVQFIDGNAAPFSGPRSLTAVVSAG